jgi:hypothetical protein
LNGALSETQAKLDRLVSGFLDGIIDKESYLQKKDELIKQKINLEDKQSDLGKRRSCGSNRCGSG